jgi:DNA-binding transcriptional ArsR family regulator
VAVELAPLPADVVRVADAMDALDALDETIHQKVRLGIMSTLMALGEADFKLLKETLGLSDGNLSTHLSLLEDRGYVEVRKEFRGKRPHTSAVPSELGRRAFGEYLTALERIIKTAQS